MSYKNSCFDEIEVTSRLLNMILDMPAEQQLSFLDNLDKSGYKGSRQHARKNLKKKLTVQVKPGKGIKSNDSFINDISRCGGFIEFIQSKEIDRSFFVGQNIKLKFQIPASKKTFKIIGEIVRLQESGIGVKFKRQL